MDDTQQSRASDVGATRKRRSSILKSQRPARTPFSELEFNVATPTDTAKSRRVSFSRRTGIAEFVTNEATTTWKTFYEEHNKSLESSGNDSDVNAPRQPGHLGKRIFNEQFEEVEAVDFLGAHNPHINANVSLNNINFTEQIASLECTSDGKLTAPRSNFELTAITDHQSKLFGNDFTVTGIGEMSGRIAVNFSAIQQIPEGDDLDEIERDLGRVSNVVCPGPKDYNVSEYIEVDLNMTHVIKNDNDMSITDTIQSPKVQDISKNCSFDKKAIANQDWIADKENIAVNPYAAPCDEENFAINDEPNKVLVFDGKRLTLEIEKPEKNYRKTLLPNALCATPQRKTIVLNTNDDLPNFAEDLISKNEVQCGPSILFNDIPLLNDEMEPKKHGDISLTQALPSVILPTKKDRNTVFEEEIYDISLTQALPANIITDSTKCNANRRSVVDNDNNICSISLTQALSTNIMGNDKPKKSEKRKTIVFDDQEGNVSITQVVSTNMILGQKYTGNREVVNDSRANVSATQLLPANNNNIYTQAQEQNRTVLYENSMCNVSITQIAPNVILSQQPNISERQRTTVYGADTADISVTRALPPNIILGQAVAEKTQIFDSANISMTQILPNNILLINNETNNSRTIVFEENYENISITQPIPCSLLSSLNSNKVNKDVSMQPSSNKRKTIIYCNDSADISMTEAIPSNIARQPIIERPRTTAYEVDIGDISVTRALPSNIILGPAVAEKTQIFDAANISMTEILPSNILLQDNEANKRRTTISEENIEKISLIQPKQSLLGPSFDSNKIESKNDVSMQPSSNKRKTIIYDNDSADISMTQAIPSNIVMSELVTNTRQLIILGADKCDIPSSDNPPWRQANAFLLSGVASNSEEKIQTFDLKDNEIRSVEMNTQYGVTSLREQQKTIVFSIDKDANTTITESKPKTQNITIEDSHHSKFPIVKDIEETTEKQTINTNNVTNLEKLQRTIVCTANMNADMSITHIIPKTPTICTEELHKNPIVKDVEVTEKQLSSIKVDEQQRTVGFSENVDSEISITEGIPRVQNIRKEESNKIEILTLEDGHLVEQEKSITFIDDKDDEMSITHNISKLGNTKDELNKSKIPVAKDIEEMIEKKIRVEIDALEVRKNLKEKRTVFFTGKSDPEISIKETKCKVENTNIKESNQSKIEILTLEGGHLIEQEKSITFIDDKDDEMSITHNISELDNKKSKLNKSRIPVAEDIEEMIEKQTRVEVDAQEVIKNLEEKRAVFFTDKSDPEISIKETKSIKESNQSEILQVEDMEHLLKKQCNDDANLRGLKVISKENNDSKISFTVENRSNQVEFPDKCVANPSITKPIPTDIIVLQHDIMNISLNNQLDLSGDVVPKNANDTKVLLDMISHITDESLCNDNPTPLLPVLTKGGPKEVSEPKIELKRLSLAPSRQSIVISREDMLNSISMAKAVLQQSQMDLDESSLTDDTEEQLSEEYSIAPHKPLHISREAVKTLHFDDESITETIRHSPLRKTAIGETSYMMDPIPSAKKECNKAKVIPTYDVSDGIKELMSDLVKPMADVFPHNTQIDHKGDNNNYTVSTEVQANLATSSQIDMDVDLPLNPIADCDLDGNKCYGMHPNSLIASDSIHASQKCESSIRFEVPQSIRIPFKTEDKNQSKISYRPCSMEQPNQDLVLVFDKENPLNNVLIKPLDNADVHKYDPIAVTVPLLLKSNDTICGSTHSQSCQIDVNTKLNAEQIQDKNLTSSDFENNQSKSELIKPASKDCSVDVRFIEVKDTEANTIIAMKGNAELLAVSSSLTLVDEPVTSVSNTTSSNDCDDKITKKSPLKVIFQVEEQESLSNVEKLESDATSNDEDYNLSYNKAKKRNHNTATPTKTQIPNVDVTPRPCIKMQKLSMSPKVDQIRKIPEKNVENLHNQSVVDVKSARSKKSPRKSKEKLSSSITVQQLLTDYNVDGGINDSVLNRQILKALQSSKSLKSEKSDASSVEPASRSDVLIGGSSATFSKNFSARSPQSSLKSESSVPSVRSSRVDWHPELCSVDSIRVPDCDSGANIVAKINMLPFMGSHECEWDSSCGDTWCFRLLYGRIRLMIRLEHRHDNAIRSRVRSDTPVIDVKVETVHQDKKNPVASLCVRFACETLRYMVSRGGCGAGAVAADVPALLRRGAAVARTALRWGRAMYDAKLHLAYTLDTEGHLALKVANIPLRSVWEVCMNLELVVENASETPWPRAGNVRVTRIVSDATISAEELHRVLSHTPKDWGHAPRTLWRIFRYLKHKTRDAEQILGAL